MYESNARRVPTFHGTKSRIERCIHIQAKFALSGNRKSLSGRGQDVTRRAPLLEFVIDQVRNHLGWEVGYN
jgi:hypothetical protein